jgi:hypothetical protein
MKTPAQLEVHFHVYLNWELGGGSLSCLLTAGKLFPIPIGEETGWASQVVWTLEGGILHTSI